MKSYISTPILIGTLPLGGENPVRLQSMTSTDTLDTVKSVEQCIRIIEAGGELVRLTTQGEAEARNLGNIKNELLKAGFSAPVIADVHFNPRVAEIAAVIADKVRINPGNYVDKRASFAVVNLSEQEYSYELERIHKRIRPLLDICKANDTALRIGVNHGSLSDRIMSRYGNTPKGMAESAMEFIRITNSENFHRLVLSLKSSNSIIMVEANRLLVDMMRAEGFAYPLHLGVTEAGEGEDGRIRSAMGIGALLSAGIGDTIRVSLSEPPEAEIPVARMIVESALRHTAGGDYPMESDTGGTLKLSYKTDNAEQLAVMSAVDSAATLLSRRAKDIEIENSGSVSGEEIKSIRDGILQAARIKITRNDYISCPTCGRTKFNLPTAVARVKQATSHLTGLKIAIMGCIVNGPGEMADADYGYIGAGNGIVHIYRGKEAVLKNIDEEKAVEELLKLIESDGKESGKIWNAGHHKP